MFIVANGHPEYGVKPFEHEEQVLASSCKFQFTLVNLGICEITRVEVSDTNVVSGVHDQSIIKYDLNDSELNFLNLALS